MDEPLRASDVAKLDGLDDWRVLLRTLQTSFRTGSMRAGVELAARIGDQADRANHNPDLHITPFHVHVTLTTHEAGGITLSDVELARAISMIASDLEVTAEPTTLTQIEVAIDALDIPLVKPFWEAVLGHNADRDDDTVDPRRRTPAFWFQQMDAPRPQRNRIHFDVTVPHDAAQRRIEAALDAGGTLVSDKAAPAFWILADPEGNEACICTWQGRD